MQSVEEIALTAETGLTGRPAAGASGEIQQLGEADITVNLPAHLKNPFRQDIMEGKAGASRSAAG